MRRKITAAQINHPGRAVIPQNALEEPMVGHQSTRPGTRSRPETPGIFLVDSSEDFFHSRSLKLVNRVFYKRETPGMT